MRRLPALFTLLCLTSVASVLEDSSVGFRFEEIAARAGIDQLTVFGGTQVNQYLIETTGCGAAFFDYDNDGWLDVFLVNGSRFAEVENAPVSNLYRNDGEGAFVKVSESAGLVKHGWGQAVCVGDYDNDGFEDLFVTYWGENSLYRNVNGRRFQDVTKRAGLAQGRRRWNSGCAFLDHDRDGDLDLFVANYIDFEPEETPTPDSGLCLYKGQPVACGPPGLPGGKNILYRNNGDGRFSDISRKAGIVPVDGTYGLGVVTSDFNGDGWVDVYVANDSNPSLLYQNLKNGTFREIGVLAGCAYSQDGKPQAGMGLAVGDYDRDGDFDIFKTNFAEDSSNLYRNTGEDFFEEAAFVAGIAINTRYLGWGCGLFDFDLDGFLDVFQVNGHVYPEVDRLAGSPGYRQPKIVYRNQGNGRFEDVSGKVGEAILDPRAGRGAAFGDFDNDGDVDVVVNNVNQAASLYRTEVSREAHWIAVRPLGRRSNRSGIGAQVTVRFGNSTLIDEVRSGGSYYSQNQLRVHFGLGSVQRVDEVEIRWPGGVVDRHRDVGTDRLLYAVEGGQLSEVRPGKDGRD